MLPSGRLRLRPVASVRMLSRPRSRRTSSSSWPTISATPTCPATGAPTSRTPNIDRIAAQGVRFLQAYANSAVCSATRLALITGRYQYRLRLGLEEPLAGNPDVGLPPEHPDAAVAAEEGRLRHDAWSASGTWARCRSSARCKSGYDHFYGFRGGARGLLLARQPASARHDLWDDDVPVQQVGLSDGAARQPRGRRR